MARGMGLEEFRNALASEARDENEKLKEEIKNLKETYEEKIKELTNEKDQYKDWVEKLGNRCYVQTRGLICISCGVDICPYAYTQKEKDSAISYMTQHHLKRNSETYEKVNKILMQERFTRLNIHKKNGVDS